ncbi:hypothetical protein EGR_06429 [Echinococcus granulosus]|uniref:Uncharacterized protein n=1 Tax=Echinococcus granulosus TaxID=6210 RepID=W6UBJ4_ECHGR|nr:hypothetical protein EGR_06429 [Echinococcus granulosus]EUB58758.1 hypothetical protein EGR_06429 [Echinococcus granulosus]
MHSSSIPPHANTDIRDDVCDDGKVNNRSVKEIQFSTKQAGILAQKQGTENLTQIYLPIHPYFSYLNFGY